MIHAEYVEFDQPTGARVRRLEVFGHAGYAPRGQDIVCAGASMLMETLVYVLADCDEAECCAYNEPTGPRVSVKLTGSIFPTDLTAMEFAKTGLALLAERYPENIHYEDKSKDGQEKMVNLQLFAEGCGDGGAAAAAASAADAAQEVQEPALRPAQERLARRSGALKGKAAGGEKLPQPPAGGSPLKEGASGSESDPAEAEKHQEPAKEPKAEKTPEERRRAFGEMVQGEYSDVFQEMMQRAIDKATENIRQNPQVARLTQALANAYGVDTEDMDGLIEAVENGRVKDEKYYEDLAQQRGVSVKTARELDKMESDLKRSNTRNAQLQAMQQEAARQQRVSQIQAQWEAQAAQLKTQYPDFELQEVLANEQVADLMRRGVSLPDAYRAAYFDHIMQQATAQTAQKVEQGVAARIQQRASRPGENGTRPGGAVTTHVDVASMSRRQLEDLERRARRGEKITL